MRHAPLLRQAPRGFDRLLELIGMAVDQQVAIAAHEVVDAGFADQNIVLGNRIGDESAIRLADQGEPARLRVPPVVCERGNMRGQRGEPVSHVVGETERDPCKARHVARHAVGFDRFALDDAGIAVARFLAGAAPIDKRDRNAALL